MERYKNLSGNAGVLAFEEGRDHIIVQFTDGSLYLYDHDRPGVEHVRNMKRYARAGRGLTTYINQYVRENYARQL